MSYVVIKLSGAHTPLYGKLKFARHVEQLKKPFFCLCQHTISFVQTVSPRIFLLPFKPTCLLASEMAL